MKAIVIGGTGATGKDLVKQLMDDSRFNEVVVLVRRPFFGKHSKLKEIVVDFEELRNYTADIQGNVAFSCLRTTLKDAGTKESQWRVDHDYQFEFASIAKENGIEAFVLLSAVGANADSSFFYNKMKGTLEKNIQKLNFNQFVVLQPGGIERTGTVRKGEKIFIKFTKALNAIGLLKSYEPLPTMRLAKAMIASYFQFKTTLKIVTLTEIKNISA